MCRLAVRYRERSRFLVRTAGQARRKSGVHRRQAERGKIANPFVAQAAGRERPSTAKRRHVPRDGNGRAKSDDCSQSTYTRPAATVQMPLRMDTLHIQCHVHTVVRPGGDVD